MVSPTPTRLTGLVVDDSPSNGSPNIVPVGANPGAVSAVAQFNSADAAVLFPNVASDDDIANPSNGMMYYNTTTLGLRAYTDGAWGAVGGGGGGGGITNVEGTTNQIVVNTADDIATVSLPTQVLIGTGTIDDSAALQLTSTTTGFANAVIPDVTGIASPVTGLQAYDTTTTALNYYNGTEWVVLKPGGSGTVTGPVSSTVGHIAIWNNAEGTELADSGGPAISTTTLLAEGEVGALASTYSLTGLNAISFDDTALGGIYSGSLVSMSVGQVTADSDTNVCSVFTDGTPPTAPTSLLSLVDIQADNGGLILSRLSATNITDLPSDQLALSAGLMVYNSTENEFQGYNGTDWLTLSGGGGGGLPTGTGVVIVTDGTGSAISNFFDSTTYTSPNVTGNFVLGKTAFDTSITGPNLAIGCVAMNSATTNAVYNTAVGNRCLLELTSGAENTAVGNGSGSSITSGSQNTLMGRNAGSSATTTSQSTHIGYLAGVSNTGGANTSLGWNALAGITGSSGANNVAIGNGSLIGLTTGTSNVGIGYQSGTALTTGTNNTLLGASSVVAATLSYQTAVGYGATVTAANTCAIGGATGGPAAVSVVIGGTATTSASAALEIISTTQGFLPPVMSTTEKDAIDTPADGLMVYDNTLGAPCYYDGESTEWVTLGAGGGGGLPSGTGIVVVTDGTGSVVSNIIDNTDTVSTGNLIIGNQTLTAADIAFTEQSIGIGYGAFANVTTGNAGGNTTLGYTSGFGITSGSSNTFIGSQAGTGITTGANNTAIGKGAFADGATNDGNNTCIGSGAGSSAGNNNCVFIGNGANASTAVSYAMAFGSASSVGASNTLVFGSSTSAFAVNVGINTPTVATGLCFQINNPTGTALGMLPPTATSNPAATNDGAMYYDTGTHALMINIDGTWTAVQMVA